MSKIWVLIWNEREEAEDATVDLFDCRQKALSHLAAFCDKSDCYVNEWGNPDWSQSDVVHIPSGETIAVVEILQMGVK